MITIQNTIDFKNEKITAFIKNLPRKEILQSHIKFQFCLSLSRCYQKPNWKL